jgi:hypothetical protein
MYTSSITDSVIYPSHTLSKCDQDYEELNGLILKKQISNSRGEDRTTRPEAATQSDPEPISFSKLWHIVIGEWKGFSHPTLVLTSCPTLFCLSAALQFMDSRSSKELSAQAIRILEISLPRLTARSPLPMPTSFPRLNRRPVSHLSSSFPSLMTPPPSSEFHRQNLHDS